MIHKNYIIFSFFSLLSGIIFFAFQKEYLILNVRKATINNEQVTANKKNIKLFYWKLNDWQFEQIPLLIDNKADLSVQHILNHWLQLLHDEKIIKKKIIIEAIMISYDQKELFISFDHLIWGKENSLFEKWMLVEGILKTVQQTDISVQKVRFLKKHKPINDHHLDFTRAWPIRGFMLH